MANINGTDGNDTLTSQATDDRLRGYAGDDVYRFGPNAGADVVEDSGGIDRIELLAGISRASVRLTANSYDDLIITDDATGSSILIADHFYSNLNRVEQLRFADGSTIDLTAPLTFIGTNNSEQFNGTNNNDTLIAGAGDDDIRGYAGDDAYRFSGIFGADIVRDSGGNDRIEIDQLFSNLSLQRNSYGDLVITVRSTGASILVADHYENALSRVEQLWLADGRRYDLVNNTFIGGGGNMPSVGDDTLTGTAGNDLIDALAGNDTVRGGNGNDTLDGDAGNDLLQGEAGNDSLFGENGNDTLVGGNGSDYLAGGKGTDALEGGLGADRFDFNRDDESRVGGARDIIRDFNQGQGDRIDLAGVDANTGVDFDQAFTFLGTGALTGAAQVRYVISGGNTIVQISNDADAAAEMEIQLTGAVNLTAANFVL